ncbi:MAG TPA: hypothetical protein VLH56_11370 [Dissulfurispiraceae bacterium]|nr:hypothetical protein [Dissulfurispiraceae bacterium]
MLKVKQLKVPQHYHKGAVVQNQNMESDPVFVAHPVYGLTSQDVTDVKNLSGTNTGDQAHSTLSDMPAGGKTNTDHDDRYKVHVDDDAPPLPVDGKLWLDTDDPGEPIIHNDTEDRDAADAHPIAAITDALIPAGKAGGQTVVGGTAASENLRLSSTSHATKGWVGINNNTDVDVGVSTGVVFRITNATDAAGRLQFDGVGGASVTGFPSLLFRRARWSGSALSAVKSGDALGGLQTFGHNGTAYSTNKASFFFWAAEDWTTTANGTRADIQVVAPGTTTAVRIAAFHGTGVTIDQGTNLPNAKLDVNGGVKVGADTDSAGSSKVGTIRYRVDGNNTYAEMCMQTGASTYAWVVLASNSW